jgi:hypothetical protein
MSRWCDSVMEEEEGGGRRGIITRRKESADENNTGGEETTLCHRLQILALARATMPTQAGFIS